MATKPDIKRRILQARDSLDEQLRQQYSQMIIRRLMQTESYRTASFLYCYMHMRSEVMTDELISQALADGKRVAIPRVNGREMEFCRIESLQQVQCGYMGIREPVTDQVQQETSLVLVPGTVFDQSGNRIGYGGGFYDRYFSCHPRHQKVGLAFQLQIVPQLKPEAHDIPMDMVITESELYTP